MLFTKLKFSPNTVIPQLAALRFSYIHVLKRGWSIAETLYPKKVRHLPQVLSQEEVACLIDAADTPFHRILQMTLYATGARRAEAAHSWRSKPFSISISTASLNLCSAHRSGRAALPSGCLKQSYLSSRAMLFRFQTGLIAVVFLSIAICGCLQAQDAAPAANDGLTLDQVIRRAQANEAAFAAAAAERYATELERKDARAGLLPTVAYHNQYVFTQSNRTSAATTQGGVNQSLPVFIANNAVHEYYSQGVVNETVGLAQVGAVRLADANAARAQAELEIARRGLVLTVVSLYYGLHAGIERTTIAQRALDEANHFFDITQKRESAREAAHADVVKAQLGQQQRQRDLLESNLAANKSRLELGVLLFPDPSIAFTLAPLSAPEMLPERQSIEAAARNNNPELRSALAALQAGDAEVFSARAALLPDLALNYTYGIDAPQFARHGPGGALNLGYSASATVDIPVWDWLTSERKVKEAHIRANAAKVALTAAQRRLLADLSEFYNEADIARQQLASLDASVLTARESLRLTNLRYVDGEGTVLDVVDAENTLISSENARVDAMVRYQQALAQLETLTGRI